MLKQRKTEKSHHYLGGMIVLRETVLAKFQLFQLVFLLFFERFFFMILIYKTKCTSYIMLFFVTFTNVIILLIQKKTRGKKV